jgi:hypothetical protein
MSGSSSDDENAGVGIMEGLKSIGEMLNNAQRAVKKLMAVQRQVQSADEMGPELQGVLRKTTHISSTLREMLGEVEEGGVGRKKNPVQPLSQLHIAPPIMKVQRHAARQQRQGGDAVQEKREEREVKKKRVQRKRGRSVRGDDEVAGADESEGDKDDEEDEEDEEDSPDDEQDDEEEKSEGEEVADRQGCKKRVATHVVVVVAKKPKLIGDGFAGRLFDGSSLLYFSLSNEKEGVLWSCPAREERENDEHPLAVVQQKVNVHRNAVQYVSFSELVEEERTWYLEQLFLDILFRFDVNFSVLFANRGCELLDVKSALLEINPDMSSIIDRMARDVRLVNSAAKVSPALSATNNAAFMVMSSLHKRLKDANKADWYQKFKNQICDMCTRCDLTFKTMERYLEVGHLMLRSNVVACLLPFFVFMHEAAIKVLLADNNMVLRLEEAFKQRASEFLSNFDGFHLCVLGDNVANPMLRVENGLGGLFGHDGAVVDFVPGMNQEDRLAASSDLEVSAKEVMAVAADIERGGGGEKRQSLDVPKLRKCRKCKKMVAMFYTLCQNLFFCLDEKLP